MQSVKIASSLLILPLDWGLAFYNCWSTDTIVCTIVKTLIFVWTIVGTPTIVGNQSGVQWSYKIEPLKRDGRFQYGVEQSTGNSVDFGVCNSRLTYILITSIYASYNSWLLQECFEAGLPGCVRSMDASHVVFERILCELTRDTK